MDQQIQTNNSTNKSEIGRRLREDAGGMERRRIGESQELFGSDAHGHGGFFVGGGVLQASLFDDLRLLDEIREGELLTFIFGHISLLLHLSTSIFPCSSPFMFASLCPVGIHRLSSARASPGACLRQLHPEFRRVPLVDLGADVMRERAIENVQLTVDDINAMVRIPPRRITESTAKFAIRGMTGDGVIVRRNHNATATAKPRVFEGIAGKPGKPPAGRNPVKTRVNPPNHRDSH